MHDHRIDHAAAFFVAVAVKKPQPGSVKNLVGRVRDLEGSKGKTHMCQSEDQSSQHIGAADFSVEKVSLHIASIEGSLKIILRGPVMGAENSDSHDV